MKCDGVNIACDSTTTPKPDFLGNIDCDILWSLVPCANAGCLSSEALTCCISEQSSKCCQGNISSIQTECTTNAQSTSRTLLRCGPSSTCCIGPPDPCANASFLCSPDEIMTCCPPDSVGPCYDLLAITLICGSEPARGYQSTCCQY